MNFIRHLKCPSVSHQVSSFFESSAYTTLSQTVIGDTLDVWILDSVASNRNRSHIHLLPLWILSDTKEKAPHCARLPYFTFWNTFLGCGPRTKDKVTERSQCSSVQGLLAEPGEPPIAAPAAVAAANVHPAPDAPPTEGSVAPLAVAILPVSAVGLLVRESRVIPVNSSE